MECCTRQLIRGLLALLVLLLIQSCSPNISTDLQQKQENADEQDVSESSHSTEVATRLREGIDVSEYSGAVDWAAVVKGGYSFAFVKATEGVDLKDSSFDDHWYAMKRAGIIRGAYHFYVTEDDPHEQAAFFIKTVVLEPGDLAPVVDVELIGHGTSPGLPQRLKTWLELVEKHYRVKPIIYTNAKFWNEHFNSTFSDYPLWIAEYDVDAPKLPAGWSAWRFWQWRGDAGVPGVEKGADLNRVNREGLDLSNLVISK